MNKIKRIAIVALAVAIIFTIQVNAAKKKVKLSDTKISLFVGESYTLKLKNTKKKVKWSSSKKSVATVSSKGKVKAKKGGNCKITAKVGKKKYTCKVVVRNTTPTPKPKKTTDVYSTPDPNPGITPMPTPILTSTPIPPHQVPTW